MRGEEMANDLTSRWTDTPNKKGIQIKHEKMGKTPYNIWQAPVSCPVCGEAYFINPPDSSHTDLSLARPEEDNDPVRVRHMCSKHHGTYIFWSIRQDSC
jgi:hypothetical protein